jgi:hypothetical protein
MRPLPLLLLAAMLGAAPALADEDGPYFYKGYDYGNQALYNPLYVLLNRGFDVLQLRPDNRNVFTQHYRDDGGNVFDNLTHPYDRVSEAGWGKFTRQELLPLSWTPKTARWVPNYGLHLIGGGTTYTALREWSVAHDVPAPAAVAATTLLTAAFINETIENKGVHGRNTDCIADFWFFDLGGILLFNIDALNEFFSEYLVVADWSLQPSFVPPSFDLHDQGNNFAVKWHVPGLRELSLFGYSGMQDMAGLSWQFMGEYSLSVAGGTRSARLVNGSHTSVENKVVFRRTAAAFLDRNNSLLASVQVSDLPDYFIHLNVFPNAFWHTDPGIGAWTVIDRRGRPLVGISITRALGLGVGAGWF